jgi:hypothetical protein
MPQANFATQIAAQRANAKLAAPLLCKAPGAAGSWTCQKDTALKTGLRLGFLSIILPLKFLYNPYSSVKIIK